jgi:hypothetical protein
MQNLGERDGKWKIIGNAESAVGLIDYKEGNRKKKFSVYCV